MTPSLLQRVQEIVPEAHSLAEAIMIMQNTRRDLISCYRANDIEQRIQTSEKMSEVMQDLVHLLEMEREFWCASCASDDNPCCGYDEDRMRDTWLDDQRGA